MLGLSTAGCGDVELTPEESLAVDLAGQVVNTPYLANEELHSRLAVLEYLGLPYEDMPDLFAEVEQRISECMRETGHSYSPVRGAIASLPVLAHGVSATEQGYFPYRDSAATEIVLGQFGRASANAIAERGDDSELYFRALYGSDPEDLAAGCSGNAQELLGLDTFDSILDGAVARLRIATEEDVVVADSRVRFAACLGSERDDFLASLDEAVVGAVSPADRSRVISEFAMTELGCVYTELCRNDR